MAELIPVATTDKKGLMPVNFYNAGMRNQLNLSRGNAGKLIKIISTQNSTYRRMCIHVEGFIEGEPINLMIYSQSADTPNFTSVIFNIIKKPSKIIFYSKVIDGYFNIFIRSLGSSGNPCFVQITHYGDESLHEIGDTYEFDETYNLINS